MRKRRTGYWMLVRTHPRQEKWAMENIKRQPYGCVSYCPQFVDPGDGSTKILFPSYLFVYTTGLWWFLKGTFGVSSILMEGDYPRPVGSRIIHSLRKRESEDGLIHLAAAPEIKIGTKVKINFGSFQGHEGEYDGRSARDRVKVLLDLFERKVRVEVAEGAIGVLI